MVWLDEEEIKARKNKILDVAFQLFCEHGIEQVSMGQIANRSGVGKRTMYRYFNNKMSLVIDVLLQKWELLIEGIRKCVGHDSTYSLLTGREQIVRWLDALRQIYINNASLILFSYEAKLNIMRYNFVFTPEQTEFFSTGIREPCVAALEKGKADGTLSFPHDSLETFYAVWASIRGCIALYGEINPCKNTYEVLKELILNALHSE